MDVVRCPSCRENVTVSFKKAESKQTCACGTHFSLLLSDDDFVLSGESENALLETIGNYKVLSELGKGAFGRVFKAYHEELDRTVAIKIPRNEQLDSQESARFLKEARAVGKLKHRGIVPVYEIGAENGRNFIVSEFVDGKTLDVWIQDNPLPAKKVAAIVAQIADAVGHAHQNSIIHRDLKPANIIVDQNDSPHVLDFGLARRDVDTTMTMTMDGNILGTPAYMAPEQARGDSHYADHRADIYSLGVILFELLTGERPFRGSIPMLISQVINEDAPSPRKFMSVSRDLETICLKCLDKDPNKRIQSADELRDELNRFVHGEPIKSRPLSQSRKALRWMKRNPKVSILLGVLCIFLVAGWFLYGYAERQKRGRDFTIKQSARNTVYLAGKMATVEAEGYVNLANLYLEYDEPEKAIHWLEQAVSISPPDTRDRFKAILKEELENLNRDSKATN